MVTYPIIMNRFHRSHRVNYVRQRVDLVERTSDFVPDGRKAKATLRQLQEVCPEAAEAVRRYTLQTVQYALMPIYEKHSSTRDQIRELVLACYGMTPVNS